MYEDKEFYESYYYHACLIIPEKDVLDTDIDGVGWISRLKRWWNDLFLVSYTSEITKGFYISSHAMRIERFRQFRKYKHRIHPMSKFRALWDFLILHVFIINKVIFRFTSTAVFDRLPMDMYYFGAFFELIIIADLYVTLKTGYVDIEAKRVILDTKKSLVHFCTKKVFIHCASAMPLHWFMFLKYGAEINCGLCKFNRFITALKIISIFSLYRVYETSSYWARKRHSAKKYQFFKFLRIMVVGLCTMSQFYDLSEAICMISFFENGYVDMKSRLAYLIALKYGLKDSYISNYKFTIYDITRIFKSFLLFGFQQYRFYYLDLLTALIGFVIAYMFYCWSVLECYSMISSTMYGTDQLLKIKRSALNILTCNQLSEELRKKVQEYFTFKSAKFKVVEKKNALYRNLPEVLKNELKLNRYMYFLMRIPLFSDWPLPIVEKLVTMLKIEVFLNSDIVILAGDKGHGLMIVSDGVLAVYSKQDHEEGHLIDGDYFSELSLITDMEICMNYVVAITNCTLLLLRKNDFRTFMKQYPKLFYNLKLKLTKKHYRKSSVTVTSISSLKGSMQT